MLTVRQRYGRTDRGIDGQTDDSVAIPAIPRFALHASRRKNLRAKNWSEK